MAAIIAAAAAGLVYYFRQDQGNIDADQSIKLVIMVASVGIGICIISATAHRWMKH